jgi:hypothetical protein
MNFNPMHYLRHAWQGANTVWGKLCIVFFYSFLWVQIIWAFQAIVAPRLGFECFYEGMSEYSAYMTSSLMSEMNLFVLGFLLYADRGGIKVWNTTMVFVFVCILNAMMLKVFHNLPSLDGYPEECSLDSLKTISWVSLIWIALAFAFSGMEAKSGSSASAESAPLIISD